MPKFSMPDYALPFVTRAMRGGRARRFAIMSGLLAFLTVFLGMFVALGSGSFEREVRQNFGFEEYRWNRERSEFTIYTDDDFEQQLRQEELSKARALKARDKEAFMAMAAAGYDDGYLGDGGWNPVRSEIFEAYQSLEQAARSIPPSPEYRGLRDQAAAYLGITPPRNEMEVDPYASGFAWYGDIEVQRLRSVLAKDMLPEVKRYTSPLGLSGAVRFVGGIAASILSLLLLVLAPLLVAVQQAGEVHENTLQPLTGTSLSPKELSKGLRAGPMAIVAIFALPLLGVMLLSSLLAGVLLKVLLLVAVLAAGGYGLTVLAQLIGHVAGRQRAPGIVGVALMLLMSVAWMIGAAIGFDPGHDVESVVGLAPQSAANYVQVWAFGITREITPDQMSVASVAFGAFAWIVFGKLGSRVLAHRVGGLEGPALSRGAALIGAATGSLLICIGSFTLLDGPIRHRDQPLFYFFGLMLLAVPFGALAMTRVPLSEVPAKLRSLPVRAIVLELFVFVAVHTAITALFIGSDAMEVFTSPVGLFYLVWSVLVVGLVAIRAAALPLRKVSGYLWVSFCAVAVMTAGVHAAAWSVENHLEGLEDVFALSHITPLLGLFQFAALIAIPALCLRGLKTNFKSLN